MFKTLLSFYLKIYTLKKLKKKKKKIFSKKKKKKKVSQFLYIFKYVYDNTCLVILFTVTVH